MYVYIYIYIYIYIYDMTLHSCIAYACKVAYVHHAHARRFNAVGVPGVFIARSPPVFWPKNKLGSV